MIIERDEMEIWIGKLLLILETLGDEILDRPRPLAETTEQQLSQSTMCCSIIALLVFLLGGAGSSRRE